MTDPLKVDTLFHLLPIGAYRSLPDGRQLRANPALVRLNGYHTEVELLQAVQDIGKEWYVDPNRRAEFVAALLQSGQVTNFVSEVYRHKTRERIWVSENAHVVRDDAGRVLYFEGTVEDITERVLAEQKLAANERRYRALTEKAQTATVIADEEGRILYASEGCRRLFGIAPENFVGSNVFDTMHEGDLAEHRAEYAAVQRGENTGQESVARHRQPDGSYRFLASLAKDYREDPAIGGIVINWRDVTETRLAEQRLREQALSDALTGLPNRTAFESRVSAWLAQGLPQMAAFLYIDLDRFKLVNDSLGHAIGDRALFLIAERMRHALPDQQCLGRLGGDEFAVFVPMTEPQQAVELARNLITAIAPPVRVGEAQFDLGASIGIAYYPEHGRSYGDLLRHADIAMYAAKEVHGNHVECYSPAMSARIQQQLTTAAELRKAIEQSEILPYYQGLVDLASGAWLGVEALARWRHPQRGLLQAADFIPIAEDRGLIHRVGRHIAEQALGQLGRWHRAGHAGLRLTLNVSAYQLRDDTFVDFLLAAIERHGIAAKRVFIEITESALTSFQQAEQPKIRQLRAAGLRLVVDDIGTGHASLARFKDLQVDGMKIDASFVSGLPHQQVDRAIVDALVAMAKSLGVKIVAEGIEREEQLIYLRQAGVEVGQGYLLAPPMSAEEITARLHAHPQAG